MNRLIALLFFSLTMPALRAQQKAPTFLLDGTFLAQQKARSRQGDAAVQRALEALIQQAQQTLNHPTYSVTYKSKVPPSGDKHDYMSVGPYWWPDSTKPDGLPYIRKDGRINPERYTIKDATYLHQLCEDVQQLAVTYYFTEDETYARRAAELLRVWFLNPETRMNSNLNYGQAIPGVTDGRGIGLIDSRYFAILVDAVQLLKPSKAWPKAEHQALQSWFRTFLDWMQTSPVGKDEADEHNNHGTYYDFQAVAMALFIEDTALARRILEQQTLPRISSQFAVDGSQPHELARTVSWGYCVMNLQGFFGLALLAENLNMNLWTYETPEGKGLKKAFLWLLPYAEGKKAWTHQQIKPMHREEFISLQALAARKYPDVPAVTIPNSSGFLRLTQAIF
ncbi:alginate lyase family protein [Siphonobacter sp.]|uniref:alginate lyase family protein n=1 Tax=Siphonobacter sp. TaxID=1869184 RepID=UPI003B3A77B1